MYLDEIEKRRQFFYPPFSRLIHITFRHKEREVVQAAAQQFAHSLQTAYGNFMVGPAEPVVNRVRNLFLMELLLKLPRDTALINRCKEDIQKYCSLLHAEKKFRAVAIVPDVDPV
jgi:primosomal protein N' (replication factor Y) (superfamily II helicase)